MTLTITLTAQNGAGVNFNAFMTSYFADFTLSGFPYILGGSSQYKGDQIVLLDDTEPTPANTKAIVLDGSDFEYYFSGHTLSGTLTTVRLSTLGNSYNSDGSFDIVGDHIANISTAVQISGLSIFNALNVRGDFHNTVSDLMGGGHDGGTADPTLLNGFVWAEAHNVVGSIAADRYQGTAFGDTVRGNGGNDMLDGKAGTDTAVFSGASASYAIVKNANGSVTVTDKRSGSPDGTDTLTNFEYARFSNGVVDIRTVQGGPRTAPHDLALSRTTVAENTGIGASIAALSAKDEEGGPLTYSLIGSTGGLFKLAGNKLQVAKPIDFEKIGTATVTLRATDPTGLYQQKSFAISILDVMENVMGTAKADTLVGGRGRDKMFGLAANDTLLGNAGDDYLLGGTQHDTLLGHAGNDRLDGGQGVDRAHGGLGNDTYWVDSTADRNFESANQGTDRVLATTHHTLGVNIENLTLLGSANLQGIGNTLANVITGNAGANLLKGGAGNDVLSGAGGNDRLFGEAGNDVLDGGAGSNQLQGGLGNDVYYVRSAGDTAFERANEGTDLMLSSVGHTLAANFENLTLTGTAGVSGTGNGVNNVIRGNAGANTLSGGAGDDYLDGGAGIDTMLGGDEHDRLVVNAGETADGGDGDDLIAAGAGLVTSGSFDGGAGTDAFVFSGSGLTFDLTGLGGTVFTRIEEIDVTGSGNNALKLGAADVIAFSDTGHAGFTAAASADNLVMRGNAGDSVDIGDLGAVGWTQNGTATIGGDNFDVYELDDGVSVLATVAVQQGMQWVV